MNKSKLPPIRTAFELKEEKPMCFWCNKPIRNKKDIVFEQHSGLNFCSIRHLLDWAIDDENRKQKMKNYNINSK